MIRRALRSIATRRSAALAVAVLACVAAAVVLLGQGHSPAPRNPVVVRTADPVSGGASPQASTPPNGPPSAQRLSPQELAGTRVIYAYAGLQPPASLVAAIRAGEAGGVIFFGGNIHSTSQLRGVINELQRAALASPIRRPLLMLTDQEGGEVRRLPGAPTASEKQIGESAHPLPAAKAAGTGAGENLRTAGINVNLAPVLDVYRQAGNFIDEFQRSYSSNPATAGSLGAAFITAQQRLGVAATAKHFPGLGAAARGQNTDLVPVTLRNSLSALRSIDEAPYRNAIVAGVKLVMTSWAIYPALDAHLPAGLSPTVIGGELRGRLVFHGVTITDSIDAGALKPFGSVSHRAVLAAMAGADLILDTATSLSHNTPEGVAVWQALTAAITQHQISLTAAQQSAARILALRSAP